MCDVNIECAHRHKLKDYVKKPAQTVLHGDFHGGNHMYGNDDNAGKVVALDYQMAGLGRAVTDLFYFFNLSFSMHNFNDVMDLVKQYHASLLEHGVNNYSWEELADEFKMLVVDFSFQMISTMKWMKPKHMRNFCKALGEKGAEFEKILECGFYTKCFILLTSMYLKNKNTFLIVDDKK